MILDFGFWIIRSDSTANLTLTLYQSKIQIRGARRIASMVRIMRHENLKSKI